MNQDPILLLGGSNLYSFVSNTNAWFDPLGLKKNGIRSLEELFHMMTLWMMLISGHWFLLGKDKNV